MSSVTSLPRNVLNAWSVHYLDDNNQTIRNVRVVDDVGERQNVRLFQVNDGMFRWLSPELSVFYGINSVPVLNISVVAEPLARCYKYWCSLAVYAEGCGIRDTAM